MKPAFLKLTMWSGNLEDALDPRSLASDFVTRARRCLFPSAWSTMALIFSSASTKAWSAISSSYTLLPIGPFAIDFLAAEFLLFDQPKNNARKGGNGL